MGNNRVKRRKKNPPPAAVAAPSPPPPAADVDSKLIDKHQQHQKRKKKGRPSLLDLQKRSLRLHSSTTTATSTAGASAVKSPNRSDHLRSPQTSNPISTPAFRRSTRLNPLPPSPPSPPPPEKEGDDHIEVDKEQEDDEGSSGGRRRKEKKLNHVLLAGSASVSDADRPKRRKITPSSDGDRGCKDEKYNNYLNGTDSHPGEPSASGPTTPLPDKKFLMFILDRLQKKDTYGVFSEPVDPQELPDYHEIIEHPMDFETVRNKLLNNAYANLEQFEKDILLISSNAMLYNAPGTIYHRQARSIQDLAKKNFENLRQDGDGSESEPRAVVRRGRPPMKNKKTFGRSVERAGFNSCDATVANAEDFKDDLSKKGHSGDKVGANMSTDASSGLLNNATFGWMAQQKAERNEEYSGSVLQGVQSKHVKNSITLDGSRRSTYVHTHVSTLENESPLLTAFDREKQLVPVGLHLEFAYARSLARFAAKLGPNAWVVASRKIETVLPPGTKFGPGWVADSEGIQHSLCPLLARSPTQTSPKPTISPCSSTSREDRSPQQQQPSLHDSIIDQGNLSQIISPASTSVPNKSSRNLETSLLVRNSDYRNGMCNLDSSTSSETVTCQLPQNPGMHPTVSGFTTAFIASQIEKMMRPCGIFSCQFTPNAQMRDYEAPGMVSRGLMHQNTPRHTEEKKAKVADISMITTHSSISCISHELKEPLQDVSLQMKLDSLPPDLNVRFQSAGSPGSMVVVETQQPDLALQL